VTGVALAVLLLAPLVGPGFVLAFDMVFVPELPLAGRLLGLDGTPRAVPSDLLVALAGQVVPGAWLQDLVLVALVVGAAWGAARLVPSDAPSAAVVAATAYGWSAYLHERLLLGQWALLVGWAVLPWAARAAIAWRRGGRAGPAVLCLAVAACGGASALLLVGLVVVLCGRPGRALVATTVLALPWLVPALLAPAGLEGGDPAGVSAFASRSDTPFGVVVSLLTGGGVWAPAAVPPGRGAAAVAGLVVLGLAALGLRPTVSRLGPRLATAASVSLVLALLGRLPVAADLLREGVQRFGALGLLRDGQKWVAPAVLLVAVAAAVGAERCVQRVSSAGTRRAAAVLAAVAPLAALPGGAWGESGRLQVSHYPREWTSVTARVDAPTVLVLPWHAYRRFPWTGERTVLDPAPRWLSARAVVDDDLPLRGTEVRGEDPLAAALDDAVSSGRPLLQELVRAGVGQVLVERSDRAADPALLTRQLTGLSLVVETPELALYDVPGGGAEPERVPLAPVLVGDLAALSLVGWALGSTAVPALRSRRRAASLGAVDRGHV